MSDKRRDLRGCMYTLKPPTRDVSIEELEKFCFNRIRLIQKLEKSDQKKEEQILFLAQKQRDYKLCPFTPEYEEADQISHFLFRLAFCKTEEHRMWLVSSEAKLFSLRVMHEKDYEMICKALESNGYRIHKETVARGEDKERWCQLTSAYTEKALKGVGELTFYSFPFEKVCRLLPTRKYYFNNGELYVEEKDLVSVVEVLFKDKLQQSLTSVMKKEAAISEDPRMHKLLTKIRGWRETRVASKSKMEGKVKPEELDKLSQTYYPPCMKVLHNALKTNNHLRHNGRMQYGLFLKGIGLTLEESITFWRSEFTKKMSMEDFQKKYLYNIKHNYGKEGKRADYTPWGCTHIIQLVPPGSGEYHGCPFKTFSSEKIEGVLRTYKLKPDTLQEILKKHAEKQYEVCCLKLFEAVNEGIPNAGSTPHSFFIEGYNALVRRQNGSEAKKSKYDDAKRAGKNDNKMEDIKVVEVKKEEAKKPSGDIEDMVDS